MSSPRRSTVLGRLLLSYAVITVSFALVAGYSVWGQQQSVRETEHLRSGHLPLVVVLRDVVAGQNTFNAQLNSVTEVRNPADKQVWFETQLALGRPKVFAQLRAALVRAFAEHAGQRQTLLDEARTIERFLEGDKEILAQLFNALRKEDLARAEQLRDELVSRGSQALLQLQALEDRVNMQLDVRMSEIAERERWTSWVLLLWVAFTLGLGGAVALYARRVLRPLEHITERAKAVASGDLSPQPALLVHDEIGDLSRTFESMVQAIAKANRELLESERLVTIGKMAAHVTHEVRNPLSSIALNLELLEEELAAGTEGRALHAAIAREVARLTELTEQYLSLARPNRPELRRENLAEVVDDALRFVERDLLRAGVRVELSVEPDLPEVLLDEAQMRQVLHNLLRNARQAMPDGGKVFVKVYSAPDAQVAVSIEDEGAGIDASLREHLFEPFFTTKVHGTGLGLSISRHIVEAHGGDIECEGRSPRGTRFVIRLPAADAARSA